MSLVTPSAKTYMNEVTFSQLTEEECDRVIDETVATYRALGIRTRWYVGPDCTPSDLGERLVRRGFVYQAYKAMGIETSAKIAVPNDVDVVRVTAANLEAFLDVQHVGWSMPPGNKEPDRRTHLDALATNPCSIHLFLASIAGEPIGTASTVLRDDGYGYLIGGQVLAHARRRGAYRALTAARLALMSASGYEYAVSYANGETSAPALERMGFETLYASAAYTLQP
jgi:hypothetical protein